MPDRNNHKDDESGEDYAAILSRPDVREAEYRALFEYAINGVAYVSPDGRFLKVNAQFAQMIGYAPRELEGRRRWQDVTHPDDLDIIDVGGLVRGDQVSVRQDKRYLHKRGFSVHCEVLVTRVADARGVCVHLIKQAAEIRMPEHNVQVTTDADGRPVLQPIVPVAEFVWRNRKWVAAVVFPAVGGMLTTLGMAAANYYELKARNAMQEIEMKRLQDQIGVLADVQRKNK